MGVGGISAVQGPVAVHEWIRRNQVEATREATPFGTGVEMKAPRSRWSEPIDA